MCKFLRYRDGASCVSGDETFFMTGSLSLRGILLPYTCGEYFHVHHGSDKGIVLYVTNVNFLSDLRLGSYSMRIYAASVRGSLKEDALWTHH
jgi:hypothetical protein